MTIPVFVNDKRLTVEPGTTLAAAVALADPGLGAAVVEERAYLTDGRGIRSDPTLPATAGAIIRVIQSAKRRAEATDGDA